MPLLKVDKLNVFYGDLHVLFDICFEIHQGEVISIVGANAAGKSTLLRSLSGLLKKINGSIIYNGEPIAGHPPFEIVEKGIIHVPEGRRVFPLLSVQENLEVGAYSQRLKSNIAELLEEIYAIFPVLAEHKNQMAGSLSGGEQQMLAIARGLMARPKLLTIDEPSLGLSPIMVKNTFQIIERIKKENVTILLVEQNVVKALNMADRAYVIENGRMVMEGTGRELLQNEHLKKAYLGI